MEVWRDGITSKVFAREGGSISGHKQRDLLVVGSSRGFWRCSPSLSSSSMSTVILFYTEVLAIKFFPAGKFNQKDLVWISAGENSSHTGTFGSLWERVARVHQDPLQAQVGRACTLSYCSSACVEMWTDALSSLLCTSEVVSFQLTVKRFQ